MINEIYQKQFYLGRILSESWKIFKKNFRTIAFITLIVYIPVNIILYYIPIEESATGLRMYFRIIQLLEAFIGIIATMAIALVVKNVIDDKSMTVGEALKRSLSKWGWAFVTNLLAGILLIGLTLLLIVPGIIYGVYWMFVIFIVVLHNKYGMEALTESKKIVTGRWWTVFGYAIVINLIGFGLGIVLGIPYFFLPDNIVVTVVADSLIDIVASFVTVAFVIFFINFDANRVKQA